MKPLTDQDRAILAKHAGGATFRDIAAELGAKPHHVRRVVEYLGPTHAKGLAMLAADPENIKGLRLTAALSERACRAIANAPYKIDVPDLERLSDVAAQGRECVARFPGVGPGVMTELDTLLARFGLTWNPRPRPFAWRTAENKHPLLKLWDRDREQSEQQETRSQFWQTIVRRVAQIERAVGTAALSDAQGRDSMEGIMYRLSFLTGYLESRAEFNRKTAMRDITPDDQDDEPELEADGNLICLPGVKLADVQPNDGGAA